MRTFDFVCDARISVTIQAKDQDAARERWRSFCRNVEKCDYLSVGCDGFYVHLAQEEPEVKECVKEASS
jgi:hypothetical protein